MSRRGCWCRVWVCAHLFIHLCTNRRTIRPNDRQSVKQTDKYTHVYPHTRTHTPRETSKHSNKQTKAVDDGRQQTTLSKVNSTNKSHNSAVKKISKGPFSIYTGRVKRKSQFISHIFNNKTRFIFIFFVPWTNKRAEINCFPLQKSIGLTWLLYNYNCINKTSIIWANIYLNKRRDIFKIKD